MRRLARRLLLAPTARGWAAITAATNILTVFLTTILVTLLVQTGSASTRFVYIGAALFIVVVSAGLLAAATSLREARFPQNPEIILKMLRAISAALAEENSEVAKLDAEQPADVRRSAAMRNVKVFLRAFEDVLSHSWSELRFGGTTELEAVIMNKGPDGYVTVGVWTRKRPRSLDKREVNPQFYDRTEAAKLYRRYDDAGVRAPIHIIPDVSKHVDYDHFGRDPSIRTNSTILFPLYSTESRLFGFVAITARNRAGLFDESDRRFWNEVWSLWEQHIVRNILLFESAGGTLSETGV